MRALFAYMAYHAKPRHLRWLAVIALLPAMGFAYLYMTDQRSTGMETFGARIWWKKLRIVHSLLYFWFVLDALTNKPDAYIPLAIDVLLGLVAFTVVHSRMEC
jgi:hypothetical protein